MTGWTDFYFFSIKKNYIDQCSGAFCISKDKAVIRSDWDQKWDGKEKTRSV